MIITKSYPSGKLLNNVFDDFFGTSPETWNKNVQRAHTPAVNISEDANAYYLELLAPGRNKEEFQISVEKGLVTIAYQKKEHNENVELKSIRREFNFNDFKRTLSVDNKINTEAIEAKYENGILRLLFPKKEEVKVVPQQIQIQ